MDSSEIAAWVSVVCAVVAIIITIFFTLDSKKIKISGSITSPVFWKGQDELPCQITLVNTGTRQAFITRICIEVSARNSWQVCVDLKVHKIDRLLLIDGEEFRKVLLLHNEFDTLKQGYIEGSDFFDRLLPMRVVFAFETSNKQFVKIPIEKQLKNRIVYFVKNSSKTAMKKI